MGHIKTIFLKRCSQTLQNVPQEAILLRPFPTPIQNLCVTVISQGPNSQSSQRAWWAASPSSEVPVLLLATSLTGRIRRDPDGITTPFVSLCRAVRLLYT